MCREITQRAAPMMHSVLVMSLRSCEFFVTTSDKKSALALTIAGLIEHIACALRLFNQLCGHSEADQSETASEWYKANQPNS